MNSVYLEKEERVSLLEKINLHGKTSWSKNGDLCFPTQFMTAIRIYLYVELFEKFIDSEIIEFLVEETKKYAIQKLSRSTNTGV